MSHELRTPLNAISGYTGLLEMEIHGPITQEQRTALEDVFDAFVQIRADGSRPQEGTGLGLAISRDLARGMQGDLVGESTPGEGSTFRLTLPAAVSPIRATG